MIRYSRRGDLRFMSSKVPDEPMPRFLLSTFSHLSISLTMLDSYAHYSNFYHAFWLGFYSLPLIFSLAVAAVTACLGVVFVRYGQTVFQRSSSTKAQAGRSFTLSPKTSHSKPMKHPTEHHSPTKQSFQSAGILRHSPDHPRILKLPVYRPIERPSPKYPFIKGKFREALEEDVLQGGFISAESLGETSRSVLHAESTGEGQFLCLQLAGVPLFSDLRLKILFLRP